MTEHGRGRRRHRDRVRVVVAGSQPGPQRAGSDGCTGVVQSVLGSAVVTSYWQARDVPTVPGAWAGGEVEGAQGPPYPIERVFWDHPSAGNQLAGRRRARDSPCASAGVRCNCSGIFDRGGCGLARRVSSGTVPMAAACRHTTHSFFVANMGFRQRFMGECSRSSEGGKAAWGAGAGAEGACVLARRSVGGGGCW